MAERCNDDYVEPETPRIALADQGRDDQSYRGETSASGTNPIMDHLETVDQQQGSPASLLPLRITSRLFVSHFLSTWNSRLFEMGAVLFIAAIYPHTLRPMSVYALVRSAAAIIFSPAIGSWIDKGDRLVVVRCSIIGQRLAVGASCGIFWVLLIKHDLRQKVKTGLFTITILLAGVEKLCSVMNLVAVERDWVVVISEGHPAARQRLNARMRRIDLFCKLFGPLVISLINGASTMVAIWVTLGISCVSVLIEYFAIGAVFKLVPSLRRQAATNYPNGNELGFTSVDSASQPGYSPVLRKLLLILQTTFSRILPLQSLLQYFHHPAFLPSISLSLLYLTVLSFSGQMITFLLSIGYTSTSIGITRTLSTIFELSATWIAPKLQTRIGAIRAGIWFLTWQMTCLAAGVSWFFSTGSAAGLFTVSTTSTTHHKILAASGLVAAVILSRVGLWGFDLCAQSIVQDEVDEQSRGAFSAVEASFQNTFELLSYLMTIVWSRPEQFCWPVVGSVAAVYVAGGVYTAFVRVRRGHLVHLERVGCLKG